MDFKTLIVYTKIGHVNFPGNNNEKDDWDAENEDVEDKEDDKMACNRKNVP